MDDRALMVVEIVIMIACYTLTYYQAYHVGKRDGIRECRHILEEQRRDHNKFVMEVLDMMDNVMNGIDS